MNIQQSSINKENTKKSSNMKKSSSMENLSKPRTITNKPLPSKNNWDSNLKSLKFNKKENRNENYHNPYVNPKDVVYEMIISQGPGLLLDIAKDSSTIENMNEIKDNLGDLLIQHVADTVVTSTISHLLHRI